MADIQEAIRRLKYLFETHGADQVTAAMQAVTASTTSSERAALSLEKSFNSLERKYVSTVRAQQDYARVQEKVNDAVKQNPALQARGNVILEKAAEQYQAASRGLTVYGKALDQSSQQGRLARHELINLSRQIQDVGVGIVSGQSPFTILVQQGAQIADVFASSTGTLKGFFGQAAAGAGRFIASTGGIVTATVAMAGSVGYVAASYASGQRDIERSLSGIGRASGVTLHQINQIGETSASAFGLSASEARTAATAFAATGTIYQENVAAATSIINDFARGGGDAAEMTKQLAAAMQDPAKGALDLNKALGFLDETTLNYIRTLQAAGQKQEAQAALLAAMAPAVKQQAQYVGLLTLAWNAATNAISNYIDRKGKQILQQIEQITNPTTPGGISGFTKEEQLVRFTDQLIAVEAKIAEIRKKFGDHPIMEGVLKGLEAESSRLTGVLLDLQNAIDSVKIDQLGVEADAAARAIMPMIAEIEKLEEQLSKLRLRREQTGGPVTGAEQVGTVRLQELKDQEATTVRVAQATQQIAALYPGMSIETARQLYDMQQQLSVAQARTGAEKLVAQEIATTIQLLAQGRTLEEAAAMAAAQRAVAQAQINSAVQGQNLQLQNQLQVSSAVGGAARIEAQHRATIVDLIRQGVAPSLAVLNADLQRANALAQINAQAREALLNLRDQNAVSGAVTGQQRIQAQGQATFNKLLRDGVDEMLASEIAAQEVANAIAAATAAVEQQIIALQESTAMINAQMNGTEIATAAQQAYNRAIRSGADEQAAAALAVATRVNLETRELAKLTQEYERLGDAASRASSSHAPGGSRTLVGTRGQFDVPWFEASGLKEKVASGDYEINPAAQVNPFDVDSLVASYIPTEQFYEKMYEGILSSGNTVAQAIDQMLAGGIGGGAEAEVAIRQRTLDRLIDLVPKEDQAAVFSKMLAQIRQKPVSLAREELIKDLTDKLKALQDSTDGLNDTIGGILSPYYSQDPRTTRLGFRAGSVGNADWLTGATNQTAIDTILGKGATAPGGINITAPGGVTVTGPGSTAPMTGTVVTPPGITSYPLKSPGIPSTPTSAWPGVIGSQITPLTEAQRRPRDITGINNASVGGSAPTVVHNDNRIIIQGSVDQDTLSKLKISRYQQTQRMRGAMTAA